MEAREKSGECMAEPIDETSKRLSMGRGGLWGPWQWAMSGELGGRSRLWGAEAVSGG